MQGLVASFRGVKEVREGLGLFDSLHGFSMLGTHSGLGAFAAQAVVDLTFGARGCNMATRGILVLVVHRKRKRSHAIGGENLFRGAGRGSRAEKGRRR